MADGVLQNTLEITVQGELFVFRIPTLKDEIKLGIREREVRRSLEIEMYGAAFGAAGMPTGDNSTEFLVRTVAQFEELLVRGPKWVYSDGPNGTPVIDYEKWGEERVDSAIEVGVTFGNELRRFRQERAAAKNPTGGQAVESKPDTRNESVQSGTVEP